MIVKWILGIVGVLVVAVGAVYAMGAAVPREHVARAERLIAMSPEATAARLRAVRDYPIWRPGLALEITGEDASGVSYVETQQGDHVAYRLTEPEPGHRFVVTITDDTLPYGGQWSFTLTPQGEGTLVQIEEAGVVRDPLYRFFARYVFGYTGTMETYLNQLEASVA